MDIQQLRQSTVTDLTTLVIKKQNELREMRFKTGSGELKQVREIRKLKKEIASILTLIKELKINTYPPIDKSF